LTVQSTRPGGSAATVRYAAPATGGSTNDVPWKYRLVHSESVIACHTSSGLAAM
jgi:hypothetical protein